MANESDNSSPDKQNVSIEPGTQQTLGTPAKGGRIMALGFGLLALAFLLVYLFLILWPSGLSPNATGDSLHTVYFLPAQRAPFTISLDVRIILMVMMAGGLGSFIHAATSFGDYVGNEKLTTNWSWWYVLRPFIGMILAIIFYLVIRGGFLSAGTEAGKINPFGIAALAALVGIFSKQAIDKLDEVFNTLFRTASDGGDAKRKDNLLNPIPNVTEIDPQSVEPKTENVIVIVKGTGFVEGAVIRVNGVNRETQFSNNTQLTAKLLPEDVAEEGEVEVTVFNPGPGGGTSIPLKLKIAAGTADTGSNGSNGNIQDGDTNLPPPGPGLTPEPEVAAEPDPEDDASHLEGCELPVTDITPDEELPASKGGQ